MAENEIHFIEEKQKELGRWTLDSATLLKDYLFLLALGTHPLAFPTTTRNILTKLRSPTFHSVVFFGARMKIHANYRIQQFRMFIEKRRISILNCFEYLPCSTRKGPKQMSHKVMHNIGPSSHNL
ncbi:hypothetical protein Ahy_A08g038160 isoform A [Arachis hypogaea]|uniref:Uncharacterized protein n=1 Tax=Arachis hypogaea TaxID=3818 RepID=A0A445BST1_ARAHY|nr:hypothetical protein Ahy_A08g038160 isoform A [Arachis hypogaea]